MLPGPLIWQLQAGSLLTTCCDCSQIQNLLLLLQGNKDGLRKLKLKIEDPPRRKHTGETNQTCCYLQMIILLTFIGTNAVVQHGSSCARLYSSRLQHA